MMTRLQEELQRACDELGLRVIVPFTLELPQGRHVAAKALIPQLGAPKGMIIVSDYALLRDVADHIVEIGYGYSVLDEPCTDEDYSIEVCREVFSEWGWGADEEEKPSWMARAR